MMCLQVASALCASYVGGSLNFAAVAASLGLAPGPLLAAAMAADNIMMAGYLAAVGVCPADPPPARAAGAAAQGACRVLGVALGCSHVVVLCTADRQPGGGRWHHDSMMLPDDWQLDKHCIPKGKSILLVEAEQE